MSAHYIPKKRNVRGMVSLDNALLDLNLVEENRRIRLALDNVAIFARRERRRVERGVVDAGDITAWDHILRFCKDGGYTSSILRNQKPEAQA